MRATVISALALSLLWGETAYLLPHRNKDARHALVRLIQEAQGELVIITDAIDDPVLQRTLRKAPKHPRSIRLMTTRTATAAAWAIYRDVDACLLPGGRALGYTLIGTADGAFCQLGAPLDAAAFRSRSTIMHCGGAEAYLPVIKTLGTECAPYLK